MTAPEQLSAPSSDQLTALVNGLRRSTDGGRPPRAWARWRAWAVEAQADADRLKALAVLAMSIERSTRATLDNTPRVLRDLPAWLSATITVLLMCAGLFTLHAILAVADVPPLESWLLPAAFGPVFVMSIKTYVGWWLGQVDNERRARRLIARLLVPAQLLAFAATVGGIAIKAMIIGTLTPLGEISSMVSSALMFGSVVLMEGVGAVALAARQHQRGIALRVEIHQQDAPAAPGCGRVGQHHGDRRFSDAALPVRHCEESGHPSPLISDPARGDK